MKQAGRLPFLVPLFLVTLLIPRELIFTVGGTQLSITRIVLLFAFPFLVADYVRHRACNFCGADFFVFSFSFWGVLSHAVNDGAAGIPSSGLLVLETTGPYLLARNYISNLSRFRSGCVVLAWMFIVLLPVCGIESISNSYVLHDLVGSLTGVRFDYTLYSWKPRLFGLGRAMGPFDHPIQYGAFCAACFGLMWMTFTGARRFVYTAACLVCAIWSMSSGPLLGIMVQIVFLIYEQITRPIVYRTQPVVIACLVALVLLEALSSRPLTELAATYLTLDPQTAWFRIAIWHFASLTIADHPIFGIANQGYIYDAILPNWMKFGLNENFSTTIDSFPLANALFFGITGVVFLFGSVVSAVYKVGSATLASADVHRASIGWTSSLLALTLVGITVHYWGPVHMFFFYLIGAGVWVAAPQGEPAYAGSGARDARAPLEGPIGAAALASPEPRR